MADISMCLRKDCKRKMLCYRYTAIANPRWQSIISISNIKNCEDFWDNEGYKKDDKFYTNRKNKSWARSQ